jgi:enoyl-CoA hydratase/carnithine racemase
MTAAGIRVTRSGGIVAVYLDRPDRHNAVTFAMWRGLAELFSNIARDEDIRGVILSGAGDCFSSGADIPDFEATRATTEQGIAYEEAVDAACDAIAAVGRPVIAAIRGYCYGGACNLAMACDFRFIAPDARMAIPAAKLSIVYGVRGTLRLFALVGLAEAKRIFFSAKPFDAEHARRIGFADRIDEDPLKAAADWLEEVASLAPLSIAGAKTILNMAAMPERPFDHEAAHRAILRALTSADYAEGRAAFGAKRAPHFRGC